MSESFVYITKTSTYMPGEAVDNDTMESILGYVGGRPSRSRQVVLRNNGIKQRYYVLDPQTGIPRFTNAQITAEAIKGLVGDGFALDSMECLSTGTTMPDQLMPNHGVMVHGELGNKPCEVVSTAGICLAGLTALKYAYLSVLSGPVAMPWPPPRRCLRRCCMRAISMRKTRHWWRRWRPARKSPSIKTSCAGCCPMVPGPFCSRTSHGPAACRCASTGSTSSPTPTNCRPACTPARKKAEDDSLVGWKLLTPEEWASRSIFAIKQDVRLLNENVVKYTLGKPLKEVMIKRNLSPEAIDWFLPHMSSEYFRQPIAECLENTELAIPQERWFTNLSERGNTGSASIYIMIHELLESGRLHKGQRLLCFVPESGRFSGGFMHLTVV